MPATWILVAVVVGVHLITGVILSVAGFEPLEVFVTGRPYRARLLIGGQVSGPIRAGAWWRLATSTLLHVDALHLGLNAVGLAVLGRWLEPVVGSLRWLGVFALTAIGASGVSQLAGVAQSDGASAGALALMTAGILLAWRGRDRIDPTTHATLPWLLGFLVLNLAITGLWPAVDAVGHLAGVGLGAVLGAVLPVRQAGRVEGVGWAAVLAATLGLLVWGIVALVPR